MTGAQLGRGPAPPASLPALGIACTIVTLSLIVRSLIGSAVAAATFEERPWLDVRSENLTTALSNLAGQMDRLGLDSATYRQLVIRTTGEGFNRPCRAAPRS